MTVCLPEARVLDVTERLNRVCEGLGRDAVIVVHMAGNDVDRGRSKAQNCWLGTRNF